MASSNGGGHGDPRRCRRWIGSIRIYSCVPTRHSQDPRPGMVKLMNTFSRSDCTAVILMAWNGEKV